jgi:hypothetical protein
MLRTAAMGCVISLLVACVTSHTAQTVQTAHVKITYESEEDTRKHNIDAISSALRVGLPTYLKIVERRRLLQPSADGLSYSAADVEAILSELEQPLLRTLAENDVAALRDLVADNFAQIRKELNLPRAAASPDHEARLVAFRWAGEPALGARTAERASTDSALTRLQLLIERLMKLTTDHDLAVDLCVVSQPTGAIFRMSAPSLPELPYGTYTTGSVVNVSRGLYAYRVLENMHSRIPWKDTQGRSHEGGRLIQCEAPRPSDDWTCPEIDLWDDSRPVLDCDFSQFACRRRGLRKGECEEAKP